MPQIQDSDRTVLPVPRPHSRCLDTLEPLCISHLQTWAKCEFCSEVIRMKQAMQLDGVVQVAQDLVRFAATRELK